MPTYHYECEQCGYEFEHLQSMTDKKLKKCPKCAKMTLVRHIGTGGGVIFKGSGFYETDYKRKDPPAGEKASSAPAASPASGGGHCHSGGCGCSSPAPAPASKSQK